MPAFELSWPNVTTNHLYRHTSRGVHLSEKARAWRDEAIIKVRQSGTLLPPGELALTIFAHPPVGKSVDPDNLAKLIIDSVFAAFGETDERVGIIAVWRQPPTRSPCILVRVRRRAEYEACEGPRDVGVV